MENTVLQLETIVGRQIFEVNFKQVLNEEFILFSNSDLVKDVHNQEVMLAEGLRIVAFSIEYNEEKVRDDIFTFGEVLLNKTDQFPDTKWIIRIEGEGVRHIGEFAYL